MPVIHPSMSGYVVVRFVDSAWSGRPRALWTVADPRKIQTQPSQLHSHPQGFFWFFFVGFHFPCGSLLSQVCRVVLCEANKKSHQSGFQKICHGVLRELTKHAPTQNEPSGARLLRRWVWWSPDDPGRRDAHTLVCPF